MNLKLCAVSLLALTAFAGAAAAQDETNIWTGLYGGVNIGGAWGTSCATLVPPASSATFTGQNCPASGGKFMGGVQGGYNYQFNQFVLGLEADVNGATSSSGSYTRTTTGGTVGSVNILPGTYVGNSFHTPGAIATVRARLGYSFGSALIYFTGGGAFAGASGSTNINYFPAGSNTPTATFTGANGNGTLTGWTMGGGIEYKLARHWSIKAEDLFVNFGNRSAPNNCSGADCANFGPVTWGLSNHGANVNVFRVGVNYAF